MGRLSANQPQHQKRPRRAIVFGEALIDVYPDSESVGGSALHVATHLAATGWHVDFITRVGADRAGGRIIATLRSNGVDTSLVEIDQGLPTGRAEVLPGGDLEIHSPAAFDKIEGPKQVHDHTLLYYGSLAARAETSRATLHRLLGVSRGLRALDLNLHDPHYTRSTVASLASRAQLIKVTTEELRRVTGLLGIATQQGGFFRANRTLEFLCVIDEAENAELFSRAGGHWTVSAPTGAVVDPVGAGDAFFARLAGALAAGYSEEAALQAGSTAAARILGRHGGLPHPGEQNP